MKGASKYRMPIHNSEIAALFDRLADFLEIKGENIFRVRAYRNAARIVSGLPKSAAQMLSDGTDFSELPGIGKDLSLKIEEAIKTGGLSALDNIEKNMPPGLSGLLAIQGLGAKRVKALYEALKIKDMDELKKAAKSKKIRGLPGFGQKTEDAILREIERVKNVEGELMLVEAQEIAVPYIEYLRSADGVKQAVIAGSYRRAKETLHDIDILIVCKQCRDVIDRFTGYDEVSKIVSKGDTKASVILRSGSQVDLRVVGAESFGAALCYFTGSQAHNIVIRKMAIEKGLKINEYGVFRVGKSGRETWVAGVAEEDVYRQIGLPYIEPELRENRGEIEAALEGRLPHLIDIKDVRGDLHAHTQLTDGHDRLEDMVRAAQESGYEYIGITEHSKRVTIAHGIDERALLKRIGEIDKLNGRLRGIRVLKSIELDILEDGSLDLEDAVLKELDYTVCAVHSKFGLSAEKQTERIIRAMDNRYFNILAHPTGRLIHERNPYEIDIESVMTAAKERGCMFELNSHPMRLDLSDVHCKLAKDTGLKIAISTDAHSVSDLGYMRFGILQARRGWIEAGDVINTRSLKALEKLLKRK